MEVGMQIQPTIFSCWFHSPLLRFYVHGLVSLLPNVATVIGPSLYRREHGGGARIHRRVSAVSESSQAAAFYYDMD